MSEENQVFRGDREPERSAVETVSAKTRVVAPAAKATTAAGFNEDLIPDAPATAELTPTPTPTPAPAPAPVQSSVTEPAILPASAPASPAPELKFEVDASQLWHAPEALARRIANLQSTSAATSHLLDEQEAETRRIEQQLKSL